jgi:hypothetical protein
VSERKLLETRMEISVRTADVWCALGAIGLGQWLESGKQPDLLDRAILDFEEAVALDSSHDDAMQFLHFLLTQRASMHQRDPERRRDLSAAEAWLERAADARAEKVQAQIALGNVQSADAAEPDPLLRQWASFALRHAPPPPPPPPPDRLGFASASEATIVFERQPGGANRTPPVRVAPAIQARKLVTKLDPELAAGGSADARVRFVVVIGKDGDVVRRICVGGNPWLSQTAAEALARWIYEPTVIDGKPVEIVTEVSVEFKTGKP